MNDKDLIILQGEQIKKLKETIYKIQLTKNIPVFKSQEKKSNSFKKFISENVEMKKYIDENYLRQLKEVQKKDSILERIIKANYLNDANVSLSKTNRNYIRIAMFLNVQEMLEQIINCKDEKFILPNGYQVKPMSLRYHTFLKSLECVTCGLKGCFLALEKGLYDFRNYKEDTQGYHLNLYALNENGQEILMTKDHIHPKSKGGLNRLENLQTMCVICNGNKGNSIEEL